GVPTNCTELSGITFSYFDLSSASTNYYYYMTFSPALGAADDDLLSLEFFDGSGYDGALTGSFTLGQGNEANYATCSRCVMVRQDALAAGQVNYFATAGTMTVSPSSAQMSGSPDVTLTDVTLVQVTVDPTTYVSTPVQQGSCLHLSSATLAGWMCNPSYSSDLDCDCGCGVVDSACASQTAMCDFCWCGTSCNPSNNAQCL
ncbi:MAG TPA: hypothetical protein VGP93_17325, partial [Polyangiaceae bacterium]|nr:hypothetical protein [Polyangiaceae bacterium]